MKPKSKIIYGLYLNKNQIGTINDVATIKQLVKLSPHHYYENNSTIPSDKPDWEADSIDDFNKDPLHQEIVTAIKTRMTKIRNNAKLNFDKLIEITTCKKDNLSTEEQLKVQNLKRFHHDSKYGVLASHCSHQKYKNFPLSITWMTGIPMFVYVLISLISLLNADYNLILYVGGIVFIIMALVQAISWLAYVIVSQVNYKHYQLLIQSDTNLKNTRNFLFEKYNRIINDLDTYKFKKEG